MQVIKPIGAFLIHSAYINSEGIGYHRCRNIDNINNIGNDINYRNYGNFKRFPSTNSFAHDTSVIESDLPSIIAAKFEPPLPSREDKLKHLLSNQSKQQYVDPFGLETSASNNTKIPTKADFGYIDEFNRKLQMKKGMVGNIGEGMYDGNEYRGSYVEIENLRDLELGRIRSHEMRNRRIFKSKNVNFEENYGMESQDGSSGSYHREYWTSQGHDPRASNKLDYRKKKKRVYEPIEVRLSLRIQEADLLNKCKFFKKKALKGHPLNFIIRVDGNPDEFMLAAEGILNKARMFLSDACTASGNPSKSNTTISLHFKPLNSPDDDDLKEYKSSSVKKKKSSYLSHLDTEELSKPYNVGDYNYESSVTSSMDRSMVHLPAIAKTDMVVPEPMPRTNMGVGSIFGNSVESVDPRSSSGVNQPLATVDSSRNTGFLGTTAQVSQEKTSRFMTLNKKKESRWIVKHSKDETSLISSTSSTTSSSTSVTRVANPSTVTTSPASTINQDVRKATASTSTMEPGPSITNSYSKGMANEAVSNIQASSKWKVLYKRDNLN